jgi:hypothetical protein
MRITGSMRSLVMPAGFFARSTAANTNQIDLSPQRRIGTPSVLPGSENEVCTFS